MINFESSYNTMIEQEGGYVLHNIPNDRGGKTFAGITYKYNPDWIGWPFVDDLEGNKEELIYVVKLFYEKKYWDRIKGSEIENSYIADSIFNFSVNVGVKRASIIAQDYIKAVPDGKIGPKTLRILNKQNPEIFILRYALAKIVWYKQICAKDKTQLKFLGGWLSRTLGLVNRFYT